MRQNDKSGRSCGICGKPLERDLLDELGLDASPMYAGLCRDCKDIKVLLEVYARPAPSRPKADHKPLYIFDGFRVMR